MSVMAIRGHPDYFVSDEGFIMNKVGHILKPRHDKDGYCIVRICECGQYIRLKLHRVVAEHFIPNPDNLPQVNHKDGDKDKCGVGNLEWCTGRYNTQHSYNTGLHETKPVIQMDTNGSEIATFASTKIASEATGIKQRNIVVAISRGTLSGGYRWKR